MLETVTWSRYDIEIERTEFEIFKSGANVPSFKLEIGDDLKVEAGWIVILLGENGCGKSTFINGIAKKRAAESKREGPAVRKYNEGYKPQVLPTITKTVREYLNERNYNDPLEENHFLKDFVLAPLEIYPLLDNPVNSLSGGQWQRVEIAVTLSKFPDLCFIDEPSVYLDVEWRYSVSKVLKKYALATNCVMFIAEHDLQMASFIGDFALTFESAGYAFKHNIVEKLQTFDLALNAYLKQVGVTYWKHLSTGRLSINKRDSKAHTD